MFINPIGDSELNIIKVAEATGVNAETIKEVLSGAALYNDVREKMKKHLKTKRRKTSHITISSNKGGVGKTFLSLQLAWALHLLGFKVLLCDLDPQANITCFYLKESGQLDSSLSLYDLLTGDAEPRDIIGEITKDFDLMGGNKELSKIDNILRNKEEDDKENKSFFDKDIREADTNNEFYLFVLELFQKIGEGYDFVIYDTAPALDKFNRITLQIADVLLLPVQARNTSSKAYGVTYNEYRDALDSVNRDISNIDDRVKVVYHSISSSRKENEKLKAIKSFYEDRVLENHVPFSEEMAEASDYGLPGFSYAVEDQVLSQFHKLTSEIISVCDDLQNEKKSKKDKKSHAFAFFNNEA